MASTAQKHGMSSKDFQKMFPKTDLIRFAIDM